MDGLKVSTCNIRTYLTKLEKKPEKLTQVLENLIRIENIGGYVNIHTSGMMKGYLDDLKNFAVGNRKIKKVLNSGTTCMVFETPAGNILKISKTNPFPQDRAVEEFDAKIFKRGKCNKTYYLLEENLANCEQGMFQEVAKMRDRINAAGLQAWDLDDYQIWQIGVDKYGKFKLRDHGCARHICKFEVIKNNIFKTLFPKYF